MLIGTRLRPPRLIGEEGGHQGKQMSATAAAAHSDDSGRRWRNCFAAATEEPRRAPWLSAVAVARLSQQRRSPLPPKHVTV